MPRSPVARRHFDSIPTSPSALPDRGLEHLAWLMDRAFKIPGTNVTVGFDALIGLIPVVGDPLTGLIQIGIVLVALHHYKVPKAVATRMAANVLVDTLVGSVPIVGDVFDATFKANTRNLKLLSQVQEQQAKGQTVSTRASKLYIAGLVALMLAVLALALFGLVTALVWLFHRPMV